MKLWQWFWWVCFVVAGSSFAVIAGVVLVMGVKDLREMIGLLEREKRSQQEE